MLDLALVDAYRRIPKKRKKWEFTNDLTIPSAATKDQIICYRQRQMLPTDLRMLWLSNSPYLQKQKHFLHLRLRMPVRFLSLRI
jgi:hypothetical protein